MKTLAIASALAFCTTAAPAFAAPAAAVAASDPAAPSVDPKADTRRVCLVDTVTGSRLERKTCRTRADWIKETGADPLKK